MRYLFLLFLISCSATHEEVTGFKMPPELEGCRVFRVDNGGPSRTVLHLVKCNNTQPTVNWTRSCGKTCTTTEVAQLVE